MEQKQKLDQIWIGFFGWTDKTDERTNRRTTLCMRDMSQYPASLILSAEVERFRNQSVSCFWSAFNLS